MFFNEARSCLGSALNIVYDLLEQRDAANKYKIEALEDEDKERYEAACQAELKIALIQTQQAYEMYLRGRVCAISPFLLIPDQKRWVEKSKRSDVEFADIVGISAAELPSLVSSFKGRNGDEQILHEFSSLRALRNGFIHSVSLQRVSEHLLIKQISILAVALGLRDIITLFERCRDDSHGAVLFGTWTETEHSHTFLRVMRNVLGTDFFDTQILGLRHSAVGFCPLCVSEIERGKYSAESPQKTLKRIGKGSVCMVCLSTVNGRRILNGTIELMAAGELELLIQNDELPDGYRWATEDEVKVYLRVIDLL